MQIRALLERRAHAGIIIPPAAPLPSELNYIALLSEPLVAAVPVSWVSQQRIAVVDGCLAFAVVAEPSRLEHRRPADPVERGCKL